MEDVQGFHKVVVKVKGKPTERLVSNYDKNIVILSDTTSDAKARAIAASNAKAQQGFTSPTVGLASNTLQSPTNQWVLLKDAYSYKIPTNPKGKPERKTDGGVIGRLNPISAPLVFVRYGDGFNRFLKLSKNAPFNYVNAEEAQAMPYHTYVLKNKGTYAASPNIIAWAEAVQAGKSKSPAPAAQVAAPQASFSGFGGDYGGSLLDIQGSYMLDSNITGKFKTPEMKKTQRPSAKFQEDGESSSNFLSGEMPDKFGGDFSFQGGDIIDFKGGDMGVDGEQTSSVTAEEADKLADEGKVEYSEAEMKKLYASSGSKKPFAEWAKSDTAKSFLKSLSSLGASWLMQKANEKSGGGGSTSPSGGKGGGGGAPPKSKNTKILGMHPVTFTIVAIAAAATLFFGAKYLKKNKSIPAPVS